MKSLKEYKKMKIKDTTCPKCGAIMKMDSARENASCEYCGYHIVIENAQAKAYAYHKGKLQAQDEASRKKKYKKVMILAIIICIFVSMGIISAFSREMSKPEVNPFDYIEVFFQGIDGRGEVSMDIKSGADGIDTGGIRFEISKERELMLGENITIRATSEIYRLSESSKVYKVEGLDEYLSDLKKIPADALALIHKRAETVLDTNLDTCKDVGVFTEMKPVKLFLLTDGKQGNYLYDVFEAHFSVDGEEQIYYVAACFSDVIVRAGNQASLNMSYGVYAGHLTQIKSWIWIMAYESVEEVRTDILTSQENYMELKELDL